MIRVIAGRFRGRKLQLAPRSRTRPSGARLRESVFAALGDRVEGATVGDLFAGTGALGIEALSRGAASALFIEIDPVVLVTLRANLRSLDLCPPEVHTRRGDARRWLRRWMTVDPPSILLIDPPYKEGEFGRLLPLVGALIESGRVQTVIIEHPAQEDVSLAEPLGGSTRVFGQGAFTMIEGKSD